MVVTYQLLDSKYRLMSWRPASDIETNFKAIFDAIISGALIPAIVCSLVLDHIRYYRSFKSSRPDVCAITFTQAIYPTIIIVLVALNRSHIEKGLSQHLESMPTPRLAITANTIERRDTMPDYRRSEVLVIEGGGRGLVCAVGMEDVRKPIEWKVDSVV